LRRVKKESEKKSFLTPSVWKVLVGDGVLVLIINGINVFGLNITEY
jgi:hypothetical protein